MNEVNRFQSLNLLKSIKLAEQDTTPVHLMPMLIDMFAENPAPLGQIYVAVMPKVGRTACWYALSASLAQAKQGYERRFNQHSLENFGVGDHVALLPAKEIYEFAGIYKEYELLRLKVINDIRNGSFTLPLSHLSRLQHANSDGRLAKKPPNNEELQPTPLDLVIETNSYGNADFFDTEVIYLGRKALFQSAMSHVEIERSVGTKNHKFSSADILPWGRISADGSVRLEGEQASHARPLIARANSALDIIEYCKCNAVTGRRIVVDNIQIIERELASLCRLMDDYNCIVTAFCGFKDFSNLAELQNTGRIFPQQIPPEKINVLDNNGIFQRVAASAERAIDFEWIESFVVSHELVDFTAEQLEKISEALGSLDLDTEAKWIIGRSFNILRALVNSPLSGEKSHDAGGMVSDLKRSFEKISSFWPSLERNAFAKVLGNLEVLIEKTPEIAQIKRKALESLVVRELSREELDCDDVVILADDNGDTLVLTGWPRRAKVQQFVFEYDFKDVYAVTFSFEERWFRLFNKSYREAELYAASSDTPYRPTINEEISKRFWQPRKNDKLTMPDIDRSMIRSNFSAKHETDPEVSIQCNLIWFTDDQLFALPEGSRLPTIKNIGRSMGSDNLQVTLVTAHELEPGDLCVFRSGSDSDLIKALASHSLGRELYNSTRIVAESWRGALNAFMINKHFTVSDVQLYLKNADLDRTVTTIRNWLYSPTAIGPKNEIDLRDLLNAIDAHDLLGRITEIWQAITLIRSSHRSAGTNISSILRDELISSLVDNEAITGHYSMSLGDVDVLEVDDAENEVTSVANNLVNQLLRPERVGF